MRTFEEDLAIVESLRHMEHTVVAWSEEGGGEVYRIHDELILFYTPMYGGDPVFHSSYSYRDSDVVVAEAHSWT